jgi:hypothetical protein
MQKTLEGQSQAENPKEKQDAKKMKEKMEEATTKSKAKKRDEEIKGLKGKWWSCELSKSDLRDLESEGFLKAGSRQFFIGELTPAPKPDKWVVTKA